MLHKHLNGGLLYRAHTGREPPHLRPTVILLDTGPACYGPIEAITRPAAFALANTLARQGVPAVLLGTGPRQLHPLDSAEARLRILTERTLEPADPHACLARARGLLQSLDGGPTEPIVLLLTHCFFAAEAERLPEVRGLRGLFVRYPQPQRAALDSAALHPGYGLHAGAGRDAGASALAPTLERGSQRLDVGACAERTHPAFARHCERWESIGSGDLARVAQVLGRLIG